MPTYTPLRRKIVHNLAPAGSPFSWQPPQGASEVSVLLVGGGGGNGADGGGGGGVIETVFKPTNGTTYTLTVGLGGVGDTNGGDTKFNDSVNDIFIAQGGKASGNGRAGGVPSTDITIVQALVSYNPTTGGAGGTGGANGGSTKFAAGGLAGSGNDGGGASLNVGGAGDAAAAGGGAGWLAGQSGTAGGDGGDGRLVLSYRLGSGVDDNVPA